MKGLDRRWILFLAGLLAAAAVGCSESRSTSTSTASSTVEVVSCPVAVTDVAIAGQNFLPAALTVAAGSTVRWTNNDLMDHTVTSTTVPAGGTFDQRIVPGASLCLKFTVAGTYNYVCTIHPAMIGTVTVQ